MHATRGLGRTRGQSPVPGSGDFSAAARLSNKTGGRYWMKKGAAGQCLAPSPIKGVRNIIIVPTGSHQVALLAHS